MIKILLSLTFPNPSALSVFSRKGFLPTFILFLLTATQVYGQENHAVDSLKKELQRFERKKAALGEDAPVMMDTLKADLLLALGVQTYQTDPDLAMQYAVQQLRLSEQIGYTRGIAHALNVQGYVYDVKGDYDKALSAYNRSAALFRQLNIRTNLTDVENAIGIIYSKKGIYAESLRHLLIAVSITKSNHDPYGMISTYNNIGTVYSDQKNFNDALRYFKKALALQLVQKEQAYTAFMYHNIGNIYVEKKEYGAAMTYFNKGLKNGNENHNFLGIANNESGLGKVNMELGRFDDALSFYKSALVNSEKAEDAYSISNGYLGLAEVYFRKNERDNALLYARKALPEILKRGELEIIPRNYELLSKIYAASGNYKAAYENQLLFKKYNDSIFNADNQRKLTEQRMNFDFKLLQEAKDRALQKQKNIRNAILAGLLTITIMLIVLFARRYKMIAKRKQEAYDKGLNVLHEELTVKESEAASLQIENENMQLKNKLMEGEKEKLQEKLDFNRRELASATMYLFQKNELLSGLKADIDAVSKGDVSPTMFRKIQQTIQSNLLVDADWERFKLHFEQVHPDFFKDLKEKHPTLTAYEVRLVAYLHLELSTKEIAGLLNITPASVIKSKVRLNKKLNKNQE